RKQAFANACGTDAGDIAYNASLPSQQFATNTYSSVQPRFEIRRALFQQLRGRSKTKDSFSSAAQGTDFQAWINENTDLSDENCEDVEEYETLNQHHVQPYGG
ncbi:hypothetical protein CBL_20786, partial [Carabus blaptoides fortunei]